MTTTKRLPHPFLLALAFLFASAGILHARASLGEPKTQEETVVAVPAAKIEAERPTVEQVQSIMEQLIAAEPKRPTKDALGADAPKATTASSKAQASKGGEPARRGRNKGDVAESAVVSLPLPAAQQITGAAKQRLVSDPAAANKVPGKPTAALPKAKASFEQQTPMVAAPAPYRRNKGDVPVQTIAEETIVADPSPADKSKTTVSLPKAKGVLAAPQLPKAPAKSAPVAVHRAPVEEVPVGSYEQRILTLGEVRQILAANKDFRRKNLAGLPLRELDFSDANLTGANLENTDLYRADFSRANLYRANIKGASLEMANFSKANMKGANLSRSSLFLTNMQGSNLESAVMRSCYAAGVKLQKANLKNADMKGSNLAGAVFETNDPADKVVAEAGSEGTPEAEQTGGTAKPHRK